MNIVAVESVADLRPGDIPVVLLEQDLPGPWRVESASGRSVMVFRGDGAEREVAWRGADWADATKVRERLNTLVYIRGEP